MADRPLSRVRSFAALPAVSPDLINMLGLAATVVAVLAAGAGIASILPAETRSPWLLLSAMAAPAGLAFLAYWWIDQRR